MKSTLCATLLLLTANIASAETVAMPAGFDINAAERFATLALACVHKEYPNKISHSLNSDADVEPPRKLTPAFYGCYDWHSSVHGHWLLARLVRTFPDAAFASSAREALRQSLTVENIAQEAVYLRAEGRASFERPYGLAYGKDSGCKPQWWIAASRVQSAARATPAPSGRAGCDRRPRPSRDSGSLPPASTQPPGRNGSRTTRKTSPMPPTPPPRAACPTSAARCVGP